MAKYSFEFKKRVVTAYLNGKGGCKALAKEYGVGNECIVRRWVHNYEVLERMLFILSKRSFMW